MEELYKIPVKIATEKDVQNNLRKSNLVSLLVLKVGLG